MGCFSSRVEAPTEEPLGPPAVELDAPTPADTAAPTQPADALPSATDLGVSEEKLEKWRKRGGGDLAIGNPVHALVEEKLDGARARSATLHVASCEHVSSAAGPLTARVLPASEDEPAPGWSVEH